MSQKTPMAVLENLLAISFADTTLWTGKAKLTAEDLDLSADKVPPEAIASLGSKHIIDPKDLKALKNIRYKMRRACAEIGTSFMAGYAVPVDEGPALVRKLDDLVKEGESVKARFLATLDSKLDAWHSTYPKWAHIMRAGSPERMGISKKIHFGYTPMMVGVPADASVASGLMGTVGMMGNNLVSEVVKEAQAFVKQSLTDGRESGSQKTVEPIRRIAQKIKGLRFLHPSFASIAEVMFVILKDVPTTGKVSGEHYLNMARIAHLLADRVRLEQMAEQLYSGAVNTAEVVETLTGSSQAFLEIEVAPVGLDAAALFDTPDGAEIDPKTAEVQTAMAAFSELNSMMSVSIAQSIPVVQRRSRVDI